MRRHSCLLVVFIALALGATHLMGAAVATAASAAEIQKKVNSALKELYGKSPAAGHLAKSAKAVAYYNTVSASYGLQGTKITKINT